MLREARELLTGLHPAGADLEVADGSLLVNAPAGVLTDEVKQALVAHKAELIELFAGAVDLLNHQGVRLLGDGRIGIWKDADSQDVRAALIATGQGDAEVAFLDDPDAHISNRFRSFVPRHIQELWDQKGVLGTPAERIEAEWKARLINRIFDVHGTSKRPSRITAADVLRGQIRH